MEKMIEKSRSAASEENQVHWVVGLDRVWWSGGGLKCRKRKKDDVFGESK